MEFSKLMLADERFYLKKKHIFWVISILAFLYIFNQISAALLPFYIAFFEVILFNGIVNIFERKFHIPRVITACIITICFYSLIVAIFITAIPAIYGGGIKVFNYTTNTASLAKFRLLIAGKFSSETINGILEWCVENLSDNIIDYAKKSLIASFRSTAQLATIIGMSALSPIVSFMMLKDTQKIKRAFFQVLPVGIQKDAKKLSSNMYDSVFKFMEGQTIAAIVLSIMYAAMLFPIGVEHFFILGIVIGFSSFVPYIGFYSATAIILCSVYAQMHDVKKIIITLAVLLGGQVIDSGFITPKIVGNRLGVHPLWVIFGVLVSVPLFGIFGILLALPMVGICNVVVKYAMEKYRNSDYYKQ